MSSNVLQKIRLLPPGPDNPRNSEGSFIKLADERLLFAYSHFYGGARDDSPSYLAGRFSDDGGASWGEDFVLLPNEGLNTMSVSFLRLQDGRIALLYLVRLAHGEQQELRCMLRFSDDEARTWSEPTCCTDPSSYYVVNNDRLIQLQSGRLVIPSSDHGTFDGQTLGRGVPLCFLSEDMGVTWRSSERLHQQTDEEPLCLQEPAVIELRDGRLMMLVRTAGGCHYRAYSADGGETWSTLGQTDLISPLSPASIRRIPATGDLLIIYNDHRNISPEYAGKRTPLVAAISRDEGETWETRRVLEDDPGGWYCYTAIHFEEDMIVLAYCAGQQATGGLNLTQVTRFPVSWLYE